MIWIRKSKFLAQRSPRRGRSNPERMRMPVWAWLVRNGLTAYQANEKFGGPSAIEAGPGWCFDRFGMTTTELPDGRVVHIGGEHEDHYDPDFYIYNDVIVRGRRGAITIHGYPEDVFPPTDFHTATQVGERIFVVGCLGYQDDRRPGVTPVFVLDLTDFSITALTTSGEAPGWLWGHTATLEEDGRTLVIRGGEVWEGEASGDNHDDFALCTESGEWTRRTRRPWQRWRVYRLDGKNTMLWRMREAAWQTESPELYAKDLLDPEVADLMAEAEIELDPIKALATEGIDFDLETYRGLFVVGGDAQKCEEHEDDAVAIQAVYRLGGVELRFEDDDDAVLVKVVGELPEERVEALCRELADRLAAVYGVDCDVALDGRSQ